MGHRLPPLSLCPLGPDARILLPLKPNSNMLLRASVLERGRGSPSYIGLGIDTDCMADHRPRFSVHYELLGLTSVVLRPSKGDTEKARIQGYVGDGLLYVHVPRLSPGRGRTMDCMEESGFHYLQDTQGKRTGMEGTRCHGNGRAQRDGIIVPTPKQDK